MTDARRDDESRGFVILLIFRGLILESIESVRRTIITAETANDDRKIEASLNGFHARR